MLQGGLGSLRLAPRTLSGVLTHFVGASSTGLAYEGIPVLVDESLYGEVFDAFGRDRYTWGTFRGQLLSLTDEDPLTYPRDVPRLYLRATNFTVEEQSGPHPVATSQAVFGSRRGPGPKQWCYAGFRPSRHDVDLHRAIEWMEGYVTRHTTGSPTILTDFDELHTHFQDVEFPIRDLLRHKIDRALVASYLPDMGISIGRVENLVVGDINRFDNVQNSTIVIRSKVENSFNQVRGKLDAETAEALEQLGEYIAEEENEEAAELYVSFSSELEKDEPQRSVLKALWNGIKAAAPGVTALLGVVAAIVKLISG